MAQPVRDDDPDPCEHPPAGALFVPVRPGPARCAARMFRTPLGDRTAVAFTTRGRLAATLGPDQAWIRLAEPALRALVEPLGVTAVTVDPQLCAPAVTRTVRPWRVRDVGVTGAAAVADALALWIG
ncbi:SAV_915 family protein [Streptomyces sp. NPDC001691]|uniref:SAV_915 family protein n=1 Tax=unclassified Streptomyces TaxID=2593676 RepID=UPI000DE8F4F6|nr:SAV_915 family protein [Streptomyces sp. SDr-06]RCH70351.1 hypothetical protein DT019_02345 [Streptomyces sp. SDr-06]